MALTYLDEEEQDRLPFYGPADPEEDDGSFDTGDPDQAPAPPRVAPPRPAGLTPQAAAIFRPPSQPPGDSYETQHANEARAKLAQVKGQVPVPAQPKWWQRLAAGAVGGMAGATNAAGRTHVDAGPAVQGIMGAGKYQHDLAQYNADVTGAQAQAEAAQAAEDRWWKNRQLQSQEQLHAAQSEQAVQHGEYWRHRAEMEQNQWKVDPKTGDLFNTITGEVHKKAQSAGEHIADLEAAGYTPEEAKIVASGGKLAQQKPARNPVNVAPGHTLYDPESGKAIYTAPGKEGDPVAEELRRQRLEDMQNRSNDTVTNRKTDLERQIQADREKEVQRALGTTGYSTEDELWSAEGRTPLEQQQIQKAKDQVHAINRRYAPRLQAVQNEYSQSVRKRGGAAEDYDVDPETLQYKARGANQPQAAAAPAPAPAANAPPKPSAASAPAPIGEGTVIRNPKTGERQILKGGRWVPAP